MFLDQKFIHNYDNTHHENISMKRKFALHASTSRYINTCL
jgi:hypothetical protein